MALTNRYVFHFMLLVISVGTIAGQFSSSRVSAIETGQNSLLFALISNGHDVVVEETIRQDEDSKEVSYLGEGTIQAVPNVDFDYDEETEEPIAESIPGSVGIVLPGSRDPGEPGEKVPERKTTEYYVVQSGDTIGSIAKRFGIDVYTVIQANRLEERKFLHPGDRLKIPASFGLLHIVKSGDTIEGIARRYKVDSERIYAENSLTKTSLLHLGDELVIPGGVVPVPAVLARRTRISGPDTPIARLRDQANRLYQEIAGTGTPTQRPPDLKVESSARLLWPTRLHHINQYYGWRHIGIDVEGYYTDPIYASADGVVVKAGWNNGGYGLHILLDHENGMQTRYAHASKLFVQPGERVNRGQVIAMVGTTGRSTGTHLHFEVIVSGKRRNPLAYTR